jgi:hypothetical protein
MAGREVVSEERVEQDEAEIGESEEERTFVVGELVGFWEGCSVRGYRTDSGEPAWVREVYGGGCYGIKMVGNTRGKVRRVKWTTLFKDGSFNTKLARVAGARVRGVERLRARAKEEAEAKLGVELKQTKRELAQIQKQNIEKDKESEEKEKRQEILTRMAERDREKAERDRSDTLKRQVEELGRDLEQDRKEDNRHTRQLIREVRQDLRLKLEELRVERLEVVSLQDKVVKEQRQTEKHKTACETWQARHKYELEKKLGDGERVLALEGEVKRKTRELFTLGKNVETIRSAHVEEIKQRDLQAQVSPFLLCVHYYLLFVVSNFF